VLLLIAEKPEDAAPLAARIDATWHFTLPDPATLAQEFSRRMPEAVLLTFTPGRLDPLLGAVRWLAGRPLPVVVYAPDASAHEIARLAELGLRHFRFDRPEETEWNAYLYALRDRSRRAGILSGTHSYLETLAAREIQVTREILESLQFGVLILEGTKAAGDRRSRHVNSMLEILLEVELQDLVGYSLETFFKRRSPSEETRRLLDMELPRDGRVARDFLPAGGTYFERTILPLYDASETTASCMVVFHDITYEIESGRRDLITGLPHRDEVPRLLARHMRWFRRRGGIQPASLCVGLLELGDIDRYRERNGPVALENLLNRTATLIRGHLGETEQAVRVGISEFILYLVGASTDRCQQLGRDLLHGMRKLRRDDGQEQTACLGMAFRALEADDLVDEVTLEDDLRRLFKQLGATGESALQRAMQTGPGNGSFFNAPTGYTALPGDDSEQSP
jgi:GGDEF domain-containing protein